MKIFRKLIIIIFLVFLLSGFVRADLESAGAAYEAGDYETAVELLIPLAEAGDAKAQTRLGVMYEKGLGVTQDYTVAIKWYRKAAEQGDAQAQTNLGFMYANGFGVPQDDTEAVMWFRKAAEQGDAYAQSNVSFMYYNGFGVPKDYVKAFAWVDIAAAEGDEIAQQARDMIGAKLNATQLKEARKLAKELSEKYGNKSKN